MKTLYVLFFFFITASIFCSSSDHANAQTYDMLLKEGHVIDPKNGIDSPMDVAINDGTIVRVAPDISAENAGQVVNAGMKDMLNVVSKFLNLGMPLQDAIEASTWKPAQVIQREDMGHLSEGAEADIAVFRHREGDFGFIDAAGGVESGDQKPETEVTIRAGRVVYDLNGIATRRRR